jgi:DNA polymerase-1
MAVDLVETLFLVDAHSLIFQVFHAIPEMSSPSGLPTNALFGFTRDMLYLRTEKKPDYLVCAFDLPGPTFRSDLYADYKAHREAPPVDLTSQIPLIHQMLAALHVPELSVAGYEADDILATLARAGARRDLKVFVCTSDKDCRQLIDGRVQLFNLRKHTVFGREELQADWSVSPEQVVDFQALVGDSVDNVPGVSGIGPKTAGKLLQEFGTLDKLLEAAAELAKAGAAAKKQGSLTPRLAQTIAEAGEKVALSRRLVRLADDLDMPLDWDAWRVQEPDVPRLLALFKEWGFRSFADQVRNTFGLRAPALTTAGKRAAPALTGAARRSTGQPVQGELFPGEFDGAEEPPLEPAEVDGSLAAEWDATYHLVDTPEKFEAFAKELIKQQRFAIDLETTSLEPRRAELVGLAFCWQAGEAWYLAVCGPAGCPVLDPARTLERLRPVLENPAVAKVNQNIKYDQLVLREHGINLAGVVGDPMVADYLLYAGERSHSLEDLAARYLNHRVIPIEELIGKGKKQLAMEQVPPEKIAVYSGEDADAAFRLHELLAPQVSAAGLGQLYEDVEIPLIEVLAELEFNGVRLDLELLGSLSVDMEKQLAQIEREIHGLAGREFNIASPKQLREVLFDDLKLPTRRRTGVTGEASTDQETLEKLAALGHELPKKIIEHRQIAKLKGTYVDALPNLVNPKTGRVHASFNQTVAATGRLSSSDPNLQNIPVRTEQGRQIRQAFLPEAGWVLLTADYSQVELRLLAHFCGDEHLRRAFAEDQDIHSVVAAQVFGVDERDVSADMRRMAKTVNFGIIYGMSDYGLAQRLGIPREEAAAFIKAYFERYPKVLDYQQQLLSNCRKTGHVGTILGRRRAISGIRGNTTYQQRNQPEREAINMEIQGSAADLMKKAMLNIHRGLRLSKFQARMLLTVHDELVFEVPPAELKPVAELVEDEMTGALDLEVPLKVDVAAGPNWLDVEEVT